MDNELRKELLRKELKQKNKGKKSIPAKYRPKYPDSAEREYLRVVNAYMAIEKEILIKYLPELKRILNEGTQLRVDSKKENEEKRKIARFSAIDNTIVRLTILFKNIKRELDAAFGLYDLKRQINKIASLDHKLTIREWKKAVSKTLGINLLDDYYSGEYYQTTDLFSNLDYSDEEAVNKAMEQYKRWMTPAYTAAGMNDLCGSLTRVLNEDVAGFRKQIKNVLMASNYHEAEYESIIRSLC